MGDMDKKDVWNLRILGVTVLMCLALLACLALDKPSQAEVTIIAHAREQHISAAAYPDVLVQLLERNPETEEFVLQYPFREDLVTDLSSYDLSQGVPLLMQWDKRWGYMEYGGSMAGITGSAPLCLAMAGYYLTGEAVFYPGNVMQFAIVNGYDADGTKLVTEGGPILGLTVREVSMVEDKVATYLQAGNLGIAAVGGGHFIVLTGYHDGMLTVNDPDSYLNSGKEWSFAELEDWIDNLWIVRAGAA